MKQEYFLITIVGLLILGYVLDAVVNPLMLPLPSPYHFFDPRVMSQYPFTTTSVAIKSIALFITPLWFLSFLEFSKLTKGSILLALSALMQLYAIQDVVSKSRVIPLEWSLSLTLTGVVLLLPAIFYLLMGASQKAHKLISDEPYSETTKEDGHKILD